LLHPETTPIGRLLPRADVSFGSNATGGLPPGQTRSPLSPGNDQILILNLVAHACRLRNQAQEYGHAGSSEYTAPRVPWNKGKLTGAKPPLRPKHVWSIRTKLQIEGRTRDLAMFNLAIDSKLRGYVVTLRVEDVAAGG
jgi:hypothetical protein